MATPRGTPRARSSGGRVLMILGVLLALAAGVLVIVIVTSVTSTVGQNEQVVVAKMDLAPGAILTTGATDTSKNMVNIQDAFTEKTYPTSLAPQNAYIYTTLDDLELHLNNEIVGTQILAGDVLRNNDARLQTIGNGAAGSLTTINPAKFPSGYVLFQATLADGPQSTTNGAPARPFAVAGDYIDILATECNLPNAKTPNVCETQTTLQNVYVYATFTNAIVLVLTHDQALQLKYLIETGKVEFVLVNPQDSNNKVSTEPVDGAAITKVFNF